MAAPLDRLWQAYEAVEPENVRGHGGKHLVDVVALVPASRLSGDAAAMRQRAASAGVTIGDAPAPYPNGGDIELPELMQIRVNTPVPVNDQDRSVAAGLLRLPPVPRLNAMPNRPARDVVVQFPPRSGDRQSRRPASPTRHAPDRTTHQ